MENYCRCGMPEEWAANSAFPIDYDSVMGEYFIVHGTAQDAKARMRYCFWCGGKLPASKRNTFFMEPDTAEVTDLKRHLSQVRTIADMQAVLGEPDFVYTSTAEEKIATLMTDKEIDWQSQHVYREKYKTLILYVFEAKNGSITTSYTGKKIEKILS